MNFTFQRNPERLLDLCGLSPIRDRRQEKLFMEKAAALEAQDLRPLVLVIGGFVPNMFETVTEYTPTIPEILVALGVYGLGGIIISVLWKIAMDVKKENGTFALKDN